MTFQPNVPALPDGLPAEPTLRFAGMTKPWGRAVNKPLVALSWNVIEEPGAFTATGPAGVNSASSRFAPADCSYNSMLIG